MLPAGHQSGWTHLGPRTNGVSSSSSRSSPRLDNKALAKSQGALGATELGPGPSTKLAQTCAARGSQRTSHGRHHLDGHHHRRADDRSGVPGTEFEEELKQREEVSLCLRGFAFRRICAYGCIPCMCTYKYILRYRSFWSTHVTANDSGRPWRVQSKNRCACADVTSGKMSHAGMHLSVCQHPHMMQTGGRPA